MDGWLEVPGTGRTAEKKDSCNWNRKSFVLGDNSFMPTMVQSSYSVCRWADVSAFLSSFFFFLPSPPEFFCS